MKSPTCHATLRKTLWLTAGVVTVAGTLFTGIGISDATTGASDATTSTPSDNSSFHWSLTNRTGQPVSGNWQLSLKSRQSSTVDRDQAHPWKIDETDGGDWEENFLKEAPTVEGHICYNHQWWNYHATASTGKNFSLEVDTNHTLHVRYVGEGKHLFNDEFDTKGGHC
ncbi:hypothetical protein R3Q06_33265 [Rhodococcus erythropolis]|uniref:hypothetical protein n=1 Tax=Rhodococcus erythropolis TaxID=1833 RepID=UPI002949F85E|nr:hypothetical protein [Rhodococcus erythropolis]MDV6278314.1 hypothetical protein [Rhodococcus erythropolis]